MTDKGTVGAPTCFVINEPLYINEAVVPTYETSFCPIKTGPSESKINDDLIDFVLLFFKNDVFVELLVSQRLRHYLNVSLKYE
jgi:hypothetical protein